MNVFSEITKSLQTVNDYKLTARPGITFTDTLPQDNEWSYDESTRIVRVKKLSGNTGSFLVPISDLLIGDKIDFYAECRNISGTKTKVGVDEEGTSTIYHSQKTGEWETIRFTHIIRKNIPKVGSISRLNIGLFTADAGEYELRNIMIKFYKQESPFKEPTLFEIESDDTYNYKNTDYRKKDGVVFFRFTVSKENNETFSNGEVIFKFAEGFRPPGTINFLGFGQDGAARDELVPFAIFSTGEFMVMKNTNGKTLNGYVSFYVGGGTE